MSQDSTIKYSNQTSPSLANVTGLMETQIDSYYFYKTETLIFLWILFAMIVVGNCSVLITLLLSRNRKTRMNFFIMHLAIADLMVGLINVATDIAWKTTVGFYAGNVACKVLRFFQVLVTYSSTYVLVSLTIDRYDAITHPLNFSGSWKRAKLLVLSSWGLSALFSFPAIFLNEEATIENRPQCWIKLDPWQWQVYITSVAISLFFLPAMIITACYSIIVHTIWTKSKIITLPKRVHESLDEDKSNNIVDTHESTQLRKKTKKVEKDVDFSRASSKGIIPKAKIKTVKMTFVIVFVFILCWSPYFIWDMLQVYGMIPRSQTTIAISTFIQSCAPLNSAANPIIFYIFSTHFNWNLRKLSLSRNLRLLFLCARNQTQGESGKMRATDYNNFTASGTQSSAILSSVRTTHFSMAVRSSPKNSIVQKKDVIEKNKETRSTISCIIHNHSSENEPAHNSSIVHTQVTNDNVINESNESTTTV